MHPDISSIVYSLNRAGIEAGLNVSQQTAVRIDCSYRSNPDGTIRWVWPKKARHADFLKFYHTTGLRPRMFALLVKLAAATGLLRIFSHGSFFLYTSEEGNMALTGNNGLRWAWFSGTIGPNRKAILWEYAYGKNAGLFTKIPLTQRAEENLQTEMEQLNFLHAVNFKNVNFPVPFNIGNGCVKLTDIGMNTRRTDRFAKLPFNAIKEWLQTGLSSVNYTESDFALKLEIRILDLQWMFDKRMPQGMVDKLVQLQKVRPLNNKFVNTTAHGDFTPWNVLLKNEKLNCIDLELGRQQMPVLFDLFHFVYQSNILIGNKGYHAVRAELDELFALPQWKDFINEHQIDTNDAERLYLLYTVTYYLDIYHQQPVWHKQVNWLLKTWNEAINWQLNSLFMAPARKLLLNDLGLMLKPATYAVLKWMHQGIETLPQNSDIDICVESRDAKTIISELENHVLVVAVNKSKKSFMTRVEIILIDGSLLHLDLINTFKRKSLVFLNAASLLAQAAPNEYDIKVPALTDDFTYTWLFYWLNNSDMPGKNQKVYNTLGPHQRGALNILLYKTYSLPVTSYKSAYKFDKRFAGIIIKNLSSSKQNKGISGLLNKVKYCFDSIGGFFGTKGFIITFSGVDGAGKSTVIENIRQLVDKQLRKKVIVLRHRPGILPILSAWKHGKKQAESIAAQTLPRQGKNSSKWSSRLRFGYYYLDYLLGQWYVQLRYVRVGYVVLYDRYYFDFINDSKRSNISLSPSFTAWWYRFLLKPRLNFFLYADEEIILSRKQELDAPTIRRLTKKYLSLFNTLKNDSKKALYIPLENNQLPDTLRLIFNHIKSLNCESIL